MSVEIVVTPEQREVLSDMRRCRDWRTAVLLAGLDKAQRLQVLECVEADEPIEFVVREEGW